VTGRFRFLDDSGRILIVPFEDILVLILSVNIIFDSMVLDCRQLRERCGVEDGAFVSVAV